MNSLKRNAQTGLVRLVWDDFESVYSRAQNQSVKYRVGPKGNDLILSVGDDQFTSLDENVQVSTKEFLRLFLNDLGDIVARKQKKDKSKTDALAAFENVLARDVFSSLSQFLQHSGDYYAAAAKEFHRLRRFAQFSKQFDPSDPSGSFAEPLRRMIHSECRSISKRLTAAINKYGRDGGNRDGGWFHFHTADACFHRKGCSDVKIVKEHCIPLVLIHRCILGECSEDYFLNGVLYDLDSESNIKKFLRRHIVVARVTKCEDDKISKRYKDDMPKPWNFMDSNHYDESHYMTRYSSVFLDYFTSDGKGKNGECPHCRDFHLRRPV